METPRLQGNEATSSDSASSLAKSLAPEEIRVGDFVAVLYEIHEIPAYWMCCEPTFGEEDRLVRLKMTPQKTGQPLKVRAVCLPFVLVKPQKGKVQTIDIRRFRLARLTPEYAEAWHAGGKK